MTVKSGPHPFGDVVELLREPGSSAFRHTWEHTPTMPRLILVPGSEILVTADRPLGAAFPDRIGETITYRQHLDIAHNNGVVEVWTPMQCDLLADDWYMA